MRISRRARADRRRSQHAADDARKARELQQAHALAMHRSHPLQLR